MRRVMMIAACIAGLMISVPRAVLANAGSSTATAQHAMTDAEKAKQLADQVAELRAQVAKLQAAQQAAAKKGTQPAAMKMPPAKPMGMMGDKSEMGMPMMK